MRKQKGFSLIELLIVVAIILIIAAIAIPNLLRARIAANEASAAAAIRTISTAEVTYQSTYPATGYAATLANLGGANPCVAAIATGCLIDQTLAAGTKSGYTFAAPGALSTYQATAVPVTANTTGVRSFCAIEDGVVRVQAAGGAIAAAACGPLPPI